MNALAPPAIKLSPLHEVVSTWYVVPADEKENARLIVSQIVVDVFKDLGMAYPETTARRRAELQSIRKTLTK